MYVFCVLCVYHTCRVQGPVSEKYFKVKDKGGGIIKEKTCHIELFFLFLVFTHLV